MTVQPITERKLIESMKNDLKKQNYRDYMLMLMQLNTGLRIGDVVKLKVEDVRDNDYLIIKEQKTGKSKRFLLNTELRKEIANYIKGMTDNDYLFPSRQVNNDGIKKNITTVQAWRILTDSAKRVGIKDFGTHSLRKSFGWFYYQKTKDVAKLMDIFNHSSQQVTLIYIGVHQAEIDKTLEDFYL